MLFLLAGLSFAEEPVPTYDLCRLAVVLPATEAEGKTKEILLVKVDLEGNPDADAELRVDGGGMQFDAGHWGRLYDIPFKHAVKSIWVLPGKDRVVAMLKPTGPNPDQTPLVTPPLVEEFVLTDDGLNGPMYLIDTAPFGCKI